MELHEPYFDLCFSGSALNPQLLETIAKQYLKLGYRTIAINLFYDETNSVASKKNKKGQTREQYEVPQPYYKKTDSTFDKLKILNRLTIVFAELNTVHKVLKSETIKKYDIIALLPTTDVALQFACSCLDVDIISFNPKNQQIIRLNRSRYFKALETGLHFEVMYAPAITDTSMRKNIIQMSHLYHMTGKSKNIIITSWASTDFFLRSPYDVMNVGLMFGLSEEQAKSSTSYTSKCVVQHAVARKMGKCVMLVREIEPETLVIESDSDSRSDSDVEMMTESSEEQPAQKKPKQQRD